MTSSEKQMAALIAFVVYITFYENLRIAFVSFNTVKILSIDWSNFHVKLTFSEDSSVVPTSKWRLGIGDNSINFWRGVHHFSSGGESKFYNNIVIRCQNFFFSILIKLTSHLSLQRLKLNTETLLPANPSILDGVDDLMQLSYLNEPSVLYNLQYRYARDIIYVSRICHFSLFLIHIASSWLLTSSPFWMLDESWTRSSCHQPL